MFIKNYRILYTQNASLKSEKAWLKYITNNLKAPYGLITPQKTHLFQPL
jgi:hypothetical protein